MARRILYNKFGNEGLTVASTAKPRIQIAVMTGATREAAVPDLTWQDGNDGFHWLGRLMLDHNTFFNATPPGTDGFTGSIVDSYCEKTDRCFWGQGNVIEGGRIEHGFRHVDGGARVINTGNTNSEIHLGPGIRQFGYGSSFRSGISNSPMGVVHDPYGLDCSSAALLQGPDPGEIVVGHDNFGTVSASHWGMEAGVASADATNRDGNATAEAFTWTVAGRFVYIVLADLTAHQGEMAWALVDFWATADPVADLAISVQNGADQATAFGANLYPVGTKKRTVIAPFFVPVHASPATWQLRITAPAIAAGANKVVLGATMVAIGRYPPTLERYASIAAPTGGATIDAEARTAINSLRAALAGRGITL